MNIPFVLLPPWRGKVGMGGAGSGRLSVPCASLSPPPSPSPVKGEGIEEGESLPEIAQKAHLDSLPLISCSGADQTPGPVAIPEPDARHGQVSAEFCPGQRAVLARSPADAERATADTLL